MTFPTVTEITPRMEPVTPDPFIAGELRRHIALRGASSDAIDSRLRTERTAAS